APQLRQQGSLQQAVLAAAEGSGADAGLGKACGFLDHRPRFAQLERLLPATSAAISASAAVAPAALAVGLERRRLAGQQAQPELSMAGRQSDRQLDAAR